MNIYQIKNVKVVNTKVNKNIFIFVTNINTKNEQIRQ